MAGEGVVLTLPLPLLSTFNFFGGGGIADLNENSRAPNTAKRHQPCDLLHVVLIHVDLAGEEASTLINCCKTNTF